MFNLKRTFLVNRKFGFCLLNNRADELNDNSNLMIQLEGPQQNLRGIGAKVTLYTTKRWG